MHAERFYHWRLSQDLTQKETAKTLGVAPNTVARWERGERAIPHWVPLLLDAWAKSTERRGKRQAG